MKKVEVMKEEEGGWGEKEMKRRMRMRMRMRMRWFYGVLMLVELAWWWHPVLVWG